MTTLRLVATVLAAAVGLTHARPVAAQSGPPGAPTNLQVTVSGNTVSLSWAAPAAGGAPTNYQIMARSSAGALVTQPINAWPTPSFVGAVPNGVYVLSVRASNAAGFGPETVAQTITVPGAPPGGPGAPGPPTNLQASVSGLVLSLSWAAPVSGGAPTNYQIIARDAAGTVITTQNAWPTPSLVATVPPGVYVVSVRASNAAGNGPETTPVSVTVPSTPPPGANAPGAPTSLQVNASGNTLSVSWGAPASGGAPTGYTLIVRTTTGNLVTTQNVWPTPGFTVGGVPNGTYVISVRAANASGAGPETAPRTITIPTAAQAPSAPRSLTATSSGDAVTFSWTAPATGVASSYQVRASTEPGGTPFAALTVAGSLTRTTVPGIPNGTYYASVVAVNTLGTSAASNEVTVTVGGGTPGTSRSTLNPPGVPTSIEARDSQIAADGSAPVKGFDDFRFANGAAIRQVAWQGIYCVATDNAPAPAPTASAFVISIHADDAGRPSTGAALASVTVPLAQANQTSNGVFVNATCGGARNTRWSLYSYNATLPASFTAAPGVRYWLSVQAITPSFAVHYGWRNGTIDTRSSYFFFNDTLIVNPFDRAFALAP